MSCCSCSVELVESEATGELVCPLSANEHDKRGGITCDACGRAAGNVVECGFCTCSVGTCCVAGGVTGTLTHSPIQFCRDCSSNALQDELHDDAGASA